VLGITAFLEQRWNLDFAQEVHHFFNTIELRLVETLPVDSLRYFFNPARRSPPCARKRTNCTSGRFRQNAGYR